jgi:hypothetical protein
VWGRSPRRLVTEGGGGRNRLLSFFATVKGDGRDVVARPLRLGPPYSAVHPVS